MLRISVVLKWNLGLDCLPKFQKGQGRRQEKLGQHKAKNPRMPRNSVRQGLKSF